MLVEHEVIFSADVEKILGPRKWKSRTDEIMELNKKEEQKALGTPVRNGAEKSNAGDDDPGTPPEFDKSDE